MADEVDRDQCAVCGAKRNAAGVVLSKCSQCLRVYYCGRECQKADWKAHKPFCAKPSDQAAPKAELSAASSIDSSSVSSSYNSAKICHGCMQFVTRINWSESEWSAPFKQGRCLHCRGTPRVVPAPGSQKLPPSERARVMNLQIELQLDRSVCFQAALSKNFSLSRYADLESHVEMKDLQQLERYQVSWRTRNGESKSYDFKFIGVGQYHACDVAREVDALMDGDDERYREGGVHYMLPERSFWGMLFNWHNHGSTMPFPSRCGKKCGRDPPSFGKAWQELRDRFDALFAAAAGDPYSVRCMFVDTPIGCLARESGQCKFAH